MSYSDDTVMRYLFGELSETERSELEAEYFGDPRAFSRLESFENDLIDDYTRGRLAGDVRARFGRAYLGDPNRRQRVGFGQALAARVEQTERSSAADAGAVSWWRRIISALR